MDGESIARELDITVRTVWRWKDEGLLSVLGKGPGGRLLFDLEEARRVLLERHPSRRMVVVPESYAGFRFREW